MKRDRESAVSVYVTDVLFTEKGRLVHQPRALQAKPHIRDP